MRDLFNGIFVGQRCTYPSRNPDGCDNPSCPDNPTHSPAWRETLLQRERDAAAARAADEARRENKRQLRAASPRHFEESE